MKLLFKSTGKGKTNSSSDVRINRTNISINPMEGIEFGFFGAIGYDDKMRLSIFVSERRVNGFFKITRSGGGRDMKYINISKSNQKQMEGFIGSYDIVDTYTKNDVLIINIEKQ